MKKIKTLKKWIPPLIYDFMRLRLNSNLGWEGGYHTWNEAEISSSGYNDPHILEVVFNSVSKIHSGEGVFARDGMVFDRIEYSFPLLSSFLFIATKNRCKLNILDFGGDLGSTYLQYREVLGHLDELNWEIVEQTKFVEIGKKFFEVGNLSFRYKIEESNLEVNSTCLLLSGVLQYLKKPYEMIEKFIFANYRFILIDRVTVSNEIDDEISVQKTPPNHSYSASYPCHIFSEERLKSEFFKNYRLVYDFNSYQHIEILKKTKVNFMFKGYLFERINDQQ